LEDRTTYGYVCLSTLVAFALFGFVVGRQADRLVELSTTDALTGLYNRRALIERLRHELARAARYEEPLSLALLDVDGLKALNDRAGHRAGDAALVVVASAVRDGSRASDFAARWGGDEFALIAPNTAGDAAASLGERVRTLVAAGGAAAGGVTVSIGIATLPPATQPADPEALVRAADVALYEAKRGGRNRVVTRSWSEAPEPRGAS
jgi:diguanylate cyclase (GGDEF)-like protein